VVDQVPARAPALEAWTDLAVATMATRNEINRQLQEKAGLTLAENLVLCRVAMSPDAAMRMADLADMLGVAKSAITKTVDRLEDRGWLERVRDDEDRRGVRAVVTPGGMAVFRRAQPVFTEAVTSVLLARLDARELRQLQRILRKLTLSSDAT
jgi:DNA-binding MarR family transcriptional regulator